MAAQAFLDGTEVTNVVVEGSATRRLNRPAQATIKIPIQHAIGGVGSRLKVVFDGSLFFHGMVLMVEDEADEDTGYTVYNATDPMELWLWRPVRDGDDSPTPGNFINPSVLMRKIRGPAILEEVLGASINVGGGGPDVCEGPLFVSLGGFASGGPNLSGAPTNWPMTIAELVNLFTSTGAVDVILSPIDSGGNMAQVDVYNGQFGSDLSGSVAFEFAMGAHNARRVRRSQDLSNMCNKLWYHLGPKVTIERFKANITGDDPCLDAPNLYNQALIESRRAAAQASYGVRMEIQQFDVDILFNEKDKSGSPPYPNFCSLGDYSQMDPTREIYRRLWQLESWIRAVPRELIHITPVRGTGINSFNIGDEVTVRAGSYFRGGFAGKQRVYEFTVSWDSDGVMELSELQTSADQDGGI